MPEAAEATEGESPGSALDTVPVDVDARAKVTGADALVVEETHDAGCDGCWGVEFRVLMVVLVVALSCQAGVAELTS